MSVRLFHFTFGWSVALLIYGMFSVQYGQNPIIQQALKMHFSPACSFFLSLSPFHLCFTLLQALHTFNLMFFSRWPLSAGDIQKRDLLLRVRLPLSSNRAPALNNLQPQKPQMATDQHRAGLVQTEVLLLRIFLMVGFTRRDACLSFLVFAFKSDRALRD